MSTQPTRPPTEPARVKPPPPTRPPNNYPQKPLRQEPIAATLAKQCRGECVSGIFSLFCDDLDTEAVCPGGASCCITAAESNQQEGQQIPQTTQRPTTQASVSSIPTLILFNSTRNYITLSIYRYQHRDAPGFVY